MIKQKITDTELLQHIQSLPEDARHIMLMADGQVRLTGINATTMVNQVRANHHLGVLETYVLGQAYIAAALIASSVKGNDRIQLSVECGGKIGGIYTEAWACGAVRGYLKNNPIPLDKAPESWDINELYGPGFVNVTRILEGSKTPFTGQTMMEYGDLAKDLALHYRESEQTPTVFSLAVNFDRQGRVTGAGGLFLQAMPGCGEQILTDLQNLCANLQPLGKAIAQGVEIKTYCEQNFKDFNIQYLKKEPLGFSCPCKKENYSVFLARLPQNEKDAILKDGRYPLELECFNCGSVYGFSEAEIKQIFSINNSNPLKVSL